MERKVLISISVSLTATIIVVIGAFLLACRHDAHNNAKEVTPSPKPSVHASKLAGYNVGRVIHSSVKPYEVFVFISIEPQRFVRDEMMKLARQLKQDFTNEQILVVEILDDGYIVNNYLPAGATYSAFNKAKRGIYHLNRPKGEEYIEFSAERGKPPDEVKIKLGK